MSILCSAVSVAYSAFHEVLGRWQSNYRENSFYQWAIVPKGLEEPVGTIGVVDQKEELSLVHIGYCIGSKWWGQGITAEALGAVISFLFEQVKVNRIESQHDPENPNSGKVMSKCGLQYEGTLRQADSSNRGIVDAALYSLLAEEYFEQKKGGKGGALSGALPQENADFIRWRRSGPGEGN